MTVIVTTSPGFGKHGRVPKLIEDNGWELVRCTDLALPDGGLSQQISRADYLVVGLVPVTKESLAGADKLKAILKHGVGVENIDIPACSAAGLPVMNTPGANADAVAELAVGLMFALARNITAGHASVASGGWSRVVGTQLGGKVLGIVGLGNIGRRLAVLARGLGMHVIASDPYADANFAREWQIALVDLPQLLAQSDYVSLHVFGGAQNAALIGEAELALMKTDACLLNLARGEVVDIDALVSALAAQKLGGVALDAYVTEPPDISHSLFSHPRVILSPHSGADTEEAVENMGIMVVEDIQELVAGRVPHRCLNAREINR